MTYMLLLVSFRFKCIKRTKAKKTKQTKHIKNTFNIYMELQEIIFYPFLLLCDFKLQWPLPHSLHALPSSKNQKKNATVCFQFWINLNDIFLSAKWLS